MYFETVTQFKLALKNLSVILDKVSQYAETKKFDAGNLLNSRLAPDQFHLTRQIQFACDNAKNGLSRLSGKTAPVFEDNETTIEQLKERIQKVQSYLEEFREEDFSASADRKIELPFLKGLYMTGQDYLIQYLIPNFYFHYTTAYSILRNNGLDIGKRDFIGNINLKPVE